MSDSSKIEWTEATWNPVTGCTKVSPGCDHCYAERITERFHGPGSFANVQLHEDKLDLPHHWRKPRRVFVNSMSDLFHESVPDEYIAEVFAVMAQGWWHTFQVLTKRHGRMRSLLSGDKLWKAVENTVQASIRWPLPNVWLGVSVEDQHWADIRIPALLGTPAAVRFLSCEPLLGAIDLHAHDDGMHHWLPDHGEQYDDGSGEPVCQAHGMSDCRQGCAFIDWVIAGGESGAGARPMLPAWPRQLRDQCEAAGIPFFFKQWGEWAPTGVIGIGGHDPRRGFVGAPVDDLGSREEIARMGKHKAGRELDGRTWDEFPAVMA